MIPTPFLRFALLGDAAASFATGLLLAAAAAPLAPWLGLPEGLLRGAGLILLPYGAAVAWLGTRAEVPRGMVLAVAWANLAWVADSLLLLGFGKALAGLAPSGLGIAFVLAQAAVVLGFALAQWKAAGPRAVMA
jgi:hypothetical protein